MSDQVQRTLSEDSIDVGAMPPIMEFSRSARTEARTFPVIATYHLSEEGRKASLLAGGDGRGIQEVQVQVPTNRFHLVSVDTDGQARLKLRPRYSLNQNQEVVRNDGAPTFDDVPSVDDLLKEAARNHQLERAYGAERAERQRKRQETGFETHQKLAEQFLADPALRALEHPKPTPRKCYLVTKSGRGVLFDAKRNIGVARQVPPEAYRRFCHDYETRREKNLEKRNGQLAVHEERDRFVNEWVTERGTRDQQERHAHGMLPLNEVLEIVADSAFLAAKHKSLYVRDGINQLQRYLRGLPQFSDASVAKADLVIHSGNAEDVRESQWAFLGELKQLLPEATVTLRFQRLSWKREPKAPTLTLFFALVTQQVGPFSLRREFLAPNE